MFRKELFLNSVHKLGLPKSKESAVGALLEAVIDDVEVNSNGDSDVTGKESSGTLDAERQLQLTDAFRRMDSLLDVYRNASVGMPRLPNIPTDGLIDELEYLLADHTVSAELHDIRQTIQMISWNVIQFNKADIPLHKWNPMYNPADAKGNAIAMIRCYIGRIDNDLNTIKETVSSTLDQR